MNDEKINYVIEMIKYMDLENKLRLAICMCDNYSHTNLEYDKKEMYKYFDDFLKEINIEYRTTTVLGFHRNWEKKPWQNWMNRPKNWGWRFQDEFEI